MRAFVGPIVTLPCGDDHEGEDEPIERAQHAEGDAANLVVGAERIYPDDHAHQIEAGHAASSEDQQNESELGEDRIVKKEIHRIARIQVATTYANRPQLQ